MNVHSPVHAPHASPDRSSNAIAASKSFRRRSFASPNAGFTRPACTISRDEAGISVGLIYRYFPSKEAVIGALAEEHKKELARAAGARPLRADAARFARDPADRALLRGQAADALRVRRRSFRRSGTEPGDRERWCATYWKPARQASLKSSRARRKCRTRRTASSRTKSPN